MSRVIWRSTDAATGKFRRRRFRLVTVLWNVGWHIIIAALTWWMCFPLVCSHSSHHGSALLVLCGILHQIWIPNTSFEHRILIIVFFIIHILLEGRCVSCISKENSRFYFWNVRFRVSRTNCRRESRLWRQSVTITNFWRAIMLALWWTVVHFSIAHRVFLTKKSLTGATSPIKRRLFILIFDN